MKLDLKKLYDRLSWDFILDILRDNDIPDRMISFIMNCITSASNEFYRMERL